MGQSLITQSRTDETGVHREVKDDVLMVNLYLTNFVVDAVQSLKPGTANGREDMRQEVRK